MSQEYEVIIKSTDWWIFGATIAVGFLSAMATVGAVIYTNLRTQKQLKEKDVKFEKIRLEEFKQSKYVAIKPSLMLDTFYSILEHLVISDDYNRMLLYSGNDGFEFFDDRDKRAIQYSRILLIANNSTNDIKEITFSTNSELQNSNTNAKVTYTTTNTCPLLRSYENILIRLTNQEQYKLILEYNEQNIPHEFIFTCCIEYYTVANQKIIYEYQVVIHNDRTIEIKKDGISKTQDVDSIPIEPPSLCRNLQDSIMGINRRDYHWEKMGKAQMKGMMQEFQTNIIPDKKSNPPQDSENDETN